MELPPEFIAAVIRVAIAGAVAGLIGGLFANSRAAMIGSTLLGAIGGIVLPAIVRISGFPPVIDAGEGFSYLYAAIGGLVLGFSVAASNR